MKVLIVGITGQTGSYLADNLQKKGYKIIGTSRDVSTKSWENLLKLNLDVNKIKLINLDPADARQVFTIMSSYKPDYVYNLAGQSSVNLSFIQPALAIDSIATSCLNFLEAIRCLNLKSRYFNAGSSECFGNTMNFIADENTKFNPLSPYAVAKCTSIYLTKIAREAYGMHACNGILSNHESSLRAEKFVTKKIIRGLKQIKNKELAYLELGNLETIRDWGFAPEYAEAIIRILEHDEPSDYLVATGKSYSLKDFVKFACELLDLDEKTSIKFNDNFSRPLDLYESRLNPKKIKTVLGWEAKTQFKDLISKLNKEQLF
tara:strand:- start:278 stop:1231 length:954 start_codon:yes stop_codon:yes gene_type:complete